MPMFKLGSAALAAALLMIPALAVAQGGSEADQEACTPDVFRLCQEAIPDEGRIVTCLQSKGPSLSGACHKVIFRPSPSTPVMREADASSTASIAAPQKHHGHRSRHLAD